MMNRRAIEHMQWQIHKQMHAVHDLTKHLGKISASLLLRTRHARIWKAPMRRHRRTEPHRTRFARSVVTHGNHEVQMRRIRTGKLIPAFTAQSFGGITDALQLLDRQRIHDARGFTARAVSLEPAMPHHIDQPLGHHAACGVTRTQYQNVIHPTHSFTLRSLATVSSWQVTRRTTATVFG